MRRGIIDEIGNAWHILYTFWLHYSINLIALCVYSVLSLFLRVFVRMAPRGSFVVDASDLGMKSETLDIIRTRVHGDLSYLTNLSQF